MLYDMHVHTTYSSDAQSSLEEYAALFRNGAGQKGAGQGNCPPGTGIGFAEHVDFLPECGSYEYMDPHEYIAAVHGLRESGCDFYAGAEIDYVKQVETEIISHLKKYNYDYTICSVHMVDGLAVSDRNFPPEGADIGFLSEVAVKYYKELEYGVKAGIFDVVGHVGVFRRYLPDKIGNDRRFAGLVREAELEAARLCAASGMIVEVNTSGLFSLSACTLPGNEFLKNYYDFGGRLVCLGSDAHRTADVGRGFGESAAALKAAGFQYLTLPWDREHRIRLE